RVAQQIDENLFQTRFVNQCNEGRAKIQINPYFSEPELFIDQDKRLRDHFTQKQGLPGGLGFPGELHDMTDDQLHALDIALDFLEMASEFDSIDRGCRSILYRSPYEFKIPGDDGQRIIQLMSQAGTDLTKRREFSGLDQRTLKGLQFSQPVEE